MNRHFWLIVIFAILQPSLLHAQEKKWWVGMTLNYNSYNNTVLKNDEAIIRPGNLDEHPMVHNVNMWSIGAHVERKVTPTLFLVSGIMGSQLNFVTKAKNVFLRTNYFYVFGSETSDRINYFRTSRLVAYNNYITIPVAVRYEFLQGKGQAMYVTGGVNTSFAVSKNKVHIQGQADNAISKEVRNEYFSSNTNDVIATANLALGWRIGKEKHARSKIECGISQPITSTIGDRKVGTGFSLSYLLSAPIKTK